MRKITKNAARCKRCGDVIESKNRHDWVCCSCWKESKGETGIFVDGGLSYLRRGGELDMIEDLSESEVIEDVEAGV